ncbi:MAG: transglutaminase domain-containing protein [Lacibacter sp.]
MVKIYWRKIKYIYRNLNFLFLLDGLLLATIFFFASESKYESQLFTAISNKIKDSLPANYSKEAFALKAAETTFTLEENRYVVFGEKKIEGIKANYFHPATVDLMTGNGACASYAAVLASILRADGMQVRIGQMKVNGLYGGHMFVETKTESGWIVLDPMFNQSFKKPDGSLAGFKDLQQNWDFYKTQVPGNYKPEYSYSGVRYANWNKIPVITPAIKSMLNFFIGKEKADQISVRPYLLRIYNKLTWLTGFVLLISLIQTARIYKRRKLYRTKLNKQLDTAMEMKIFAA